MPSFHASMGNLQIARARWRQPRPWRSPAESKMIQHFVYLWLTCRDRSRPSGRQWARKLSISHTWLQVLVRAFKDPSVRAYFEQKHRSWTPRSADLTRAQADTERMRAKGMLRCK